MVVLAEKVSEKRKYGTLDRKYICEIKYTDKALCFNIDERAFILCFRDMS
jgi:hypothetical protein